MRVIYSKTHKIIVTGSNENFKFSVFPKTGEITYADPATDGNTYPTLKKAINAADKYIEENRI